MSPRPHWHLDELDTPFLAVDLDVFEENVAACFDRLAHVKYRRLRPVSNARAPYT